MGNFFYFGRGGYANISGESRGQYQLERCCGRYLHHWYFYFSCNICQQGFILDFRRVFNFSLTSGVTKDFSLSLPERSSMRL